jgi:hypothetical protein
MGFHRGPTIVKDGLVLYLDAGNKKSYPTSGTLWRDLSGNGNNGTLINGPTFDSGNNGSIVFDGVDDYVNINNENNLTVSVISVCAWVKPDINLMNPFANIANKLTGNSENGWSLERFGTSTNISWWVGDRTISTSPWSSNSIQVNFTNNEWQYFVGTFDGTNLKLYKNSNLGNQKISSMGILTGSSIMRIGNHGTLNYYWKDNISQVSIYNRALTPTEITQNYNATKSRFNL